MKVWPFNRKRWIQLILYWENRRLVSVSRATFNRHMWHFSRPDMASFWAISNSAQCVPCNGVTLFFFVSYHLASIIVLEESCSNISTHFSVAEKVLPIQFLLSKLIGRRRMDFWRRERENKNWPRTVETFPPTGFTGTFEKELRDEEDPLFDRHWLELKRKLRCFAITRIIQRWSSAINKHFPIYEELSCTLLA